MFHPQCLERGTDSKDSPGRRSYKSPDTLKETAEACRGAYENHRGWMSGMNLEPGFDHWGWLRGGWEMGVRTGDVRLLTATADGLVRPMAQITEV